MPFNGSGIYNVVYNWTQDAANGIKILASRQDTQWADIANNGFDNCLTRDGQGIATANLPMGGFKHTGVANGVASTDYAAYGQLLTSVAAFTGYIGGLTLSTAGSSATFGIAAGVATDSTSALFMQLASAFTKTTSTWAVGTGNGSLDTGTIAISTWYHVFIIGATATAPDILVSLSPTAPTLPGGYTLFRRIGSMMTDGSAHWILFLQKGNHFLWNVAVNNGAVTVATTGTSAILLVPTGIMVNAEFNLGVGGTPTDFLLVSSLNAVNSATNSPVGNISMNLFGQPLNAPFAIDTNTAAQIRLRSGAGSLTVNIAATGWKDYF